MGYSFEALHYFLTVLSEWEPSVKQRRYARLGLNERLRSKAR